MVDENPSTVSLPSVSPRYEYDQSGITMAEVTALSPRPARPAHPPESAVLAVPPESALLPMAVAVTLPEVDPHQWQHAVLQS